MRRPPRNLGLRAESFELERRQLLASEFGSLPANIHAVEFAAGMLSPFDVPIQVVTQQAGEATVTVERSDTAGSLQVEVKTDPNSPYVGVNVGAVDQTVTFADGQAQAIVTVPILPGAPNPGEVDVNLEINPISPSTGNISLTGTALSLKVVESDPTLPPKVVSAVLLDHGILVSFDKPMDPAGASNVNSYAVTLDSKPLKLRSAQYNPATQSVVLVAKNPGSFSLISSTLAVVHRAKAPARTGHSSKAGPGLADLQGNPINPRTTPGLLELSERSGYLHV